MSFGNKQRKRPRKKNAKAMRRELCIGRKKRMMGEGANAYKALAMSFEPIASKEFRLRKEEERKDSVIPVFLTEKSEDYRPRI